MRPVAAIWMVLFAWSSIKAQTSKAVIEGVVINAGTGAPVDGARLRLAGKGAELGSKPDIEPMFAETDAAGRFVFEGLMPDLFTLQVQSPDAVPIGTYLPFAFVDLRVAPTPTPYKIENGPQVTVERLTQRDGTLRAKVRINLSFYATIDGKVTSPDGLPMERCLIEMFREVPPGLSEREGYYALRIPSTQKEVFRMSGLTLSTNDQGEYHAVHLEPGTYYVKEKCNEFSQAPLWKPGYRETFYPEATDIAAAAPIRVAAGEHARADIRISAVKGFRITGRLVNALPDTHVQVNWVDAFTFRFFQGTIVNDRYSIENVLPGRYALIAVIPDGDTGAGRRIEVIDRNLDGEDLTLQEFPSLAGTVTFPEGCVSSPVKVGLFFMHADQPVEATPDANGHFLLLHVPPVRFGVHSFGRQYFMDHPRIRLGDELGGTDIIRFGPASSGESLQIEMPCIDSRRQP